MKKRLIIGDVHGLGEIVEQAYINEQPDEVILLGDYSDSSDKNITPEIMKKSFETIMILRTLHYAGHPKNSFHILMGNHDLHYILYDEEYSGKSHKTGQLMRPLYEKCLDANVLKIAYIDHINKIIYSHAGVTNTWLKERCNGACLDEINDLSLDYMRFTYGADEKYSLTGNTRWSSPLWVRPPSLIEDPYIDKDGYVWHQIFGHTAFEKPISFSCGDINDYYIYPRKTFYDGIFKCIDTFPRYYMVQMIDDDGKLIETKIVKHQWDHDDNEHTEIK